MIQLRPEDMVCGQPICSRWIDAGVGVYCDLYATGDPTRQLAVLIEVRGELRLHHWTSADLCIKSVLFNADIDRLRELATSEIAAMTARMGDMRDHITGRFGPAGVKQENAEFLRPCPQPMSITDPEEGRSRWP